MVNFVKSQTSTGISQTNTFGTFVTSISHEDPKPQRVISQTYPVHM